MAIDLHVVWWIHEGRIHVAARVGHLAQRGGAPRNHQHARGRRAQDHAAHPPAMLEREVLRHRAAPAHPHDVDLVETELVEQLGGGA